MKFVRLVLVLTILGLFCGMVLPCVNAIVFDVGVKISESDLTPNNDQWYYFDSGCMMQSDSDYKNEIPLLFDGNESTGINKNYGPGHNWMMIWLFFPYSYYVSNITVKPVFGGSATNYSLNIAAGGGLFDAFATDIGIQKTFQIRGRITTIRLWLDNKGTNQFNFNDIIINYTVNVTDINETASAINALSNRVNLLQIKVNNLTSEFNEMKNTISELNNTIFIFNRTQQQILENITDLWSNYNLLNESILNILTEIDNLNISTSENINNLWTTFNQLNISFMKIIADLETLNLTTQENITIINTNLILIENDINEIYKSITNLTAEIDNFPELQNKIDTATNKIFNLNENLTEIKNTMPSEYNDSVLTDRMSQLEIENLALKNEIENLTTEIENLEGSEKERVIEKQPDNSVVYLPIIIAIIAIIMAIFAIVIKKRAPPPAPPLVEAKPPEGEQQVNQIPEAETVEPSEDQPAPQAPQVGQSPPSQPSQPPPVEVQQ